MLARAVQRARCLPSHLPKQGRPLAAVTSRALSSSEKESYTARQAKTGRPLSPHVTIYDFPAAALTSIANRVTGVALVAGLYGIAGASLVGCDAPALMNTLGTSGAGPAVKCVVAFPLVYHYLGAVRHTVWDYVPETLQTTGVAKTSYALLGVSGAITLGLAAV